METTHGEASQVLVLLSNYADKKNVLMKQRWFMQYIDSKDAYLKTFIIPNILKGMWLKMKISNIKAKNMKLHRIPN